MIDPKTAESPVIQADRRSFVLRGVVTKISWNFVDQALSAASNFVLAILVARSVGVTDFGAFSIAFLIYGIAVAAMKSVVGQPLQIRYSGADATEQRAQIGRALGFVLAAALLGAAVAAAVGAVLHGPVGASLLALAVVLPFLLVQDSCRMAMFTIGKPAQAAVIDAVWTVAQFGALVVVLAAGLGRVWLLILVWGVAAGISALIGLALLRVRPQIRQAVVWARAQSQLIRYLLPEYLLGLGAAQFGLILVSLVASTESVGSLRAAQVLLGPLGVVASAVFQFAVPEISARPQLPGRLRTLFGLTISAGLGVITVCYVAVLLLLPDRIGGALFGDSWAGAAAVLLPMGLSSLASSQANGPSSVLYAMGRAQWTFRISLVKGPVLLIILVLGAALWGASGGAWAFFAIELAVLPAWLFAFRTAVRSGEIVDDRRLPARTASSDSPLT